MARQGMKWKEMKNELEWGASKHGRQHFIHFLRETGLFNNVRSV